MNAARLLRGPIGWAIGLMLVVLACASVFTTVPETQQAVILRMGVPRAVVNLYRSDQAYGQTGAGLVARVPLLDQVFYVDRREQTLDLESQPLLSSDGARLEADAFARYRVVDPTRYYLASHGDNRALGDALKAALGTALRVQLSGLSTAQLLAPEHSAALHKVRDALDRAAQRFGARVSEVRLDRVDLPDGAPLDDALARMRGVREQQAGDIRDDGYKQALQIRVEGDAQATKAYADAFGQDPDFYDFYRAMQSYRITMGDGQTRMVLSPQSEYFRQFRTGGKQ